MRGVDGGLTAAAAFAAGNLLIRLPASVCLLLIAGCTVGPDYHPKSGSCSAELS
jgi:hypothetical protein